MAPQRPAALLAACLLASRPRPAELWRGEVAGEALDAAGSSGLPHCKAVFEGWLGKGGIPQQDGQKLITDGVGCLSPCTHWCDAMLGRHQDLAFAALRDVAASFAISSEGLLADASWADTCSMGTSYRQKCLLQVHRANLDAVNAKLKARQGESGRQNKISRELIDEKSAIGQWGFRVKKYTPPLRFGDPSGLFACKCSSCAASVASSHMRKMGFDTGVHFASLQCQSASKGYAVDCEDFLSQCKCYQCFDGTDQEDRDIAGEGSFLLGGAGRRYQPETAGAVRDVIQQYAGGGACRGSCDYDRKMFTGTQ
mmetsp:Transcript_85087/g.206289  ORF Transcript_85087/g.206289 Transcript_85087/m.206289 type:complete len:311 (+) Transcript_85087:85-1017(+)